MFEESASQGYLQKRSIKFAITFGLLIVLAVICGLTFRILCVTFVDNYELGYTYDRRTGVIERLDRTGYFVTPPILKQVHTIDLRPMQVCINANARVLNCKLVQFDPAGLGTFLAWHGRNDYDAGQNGNLNQILMSYAYDESGKTYPFLTVVRELKSNDIIQAPTSLPKPSEDPR